MTVVSTKPEISHESAFGTLVLNRQPGSIHYYQGKASCVTEALCFINHCQGGTIHDFCRQYGYDFTKHIGEKDIEVCEDGAGRAMWLNLPYEKEDGSRCIGHKKAFLSPNHKAA